jgi:hypothetical protein
MVVAGRVVLTLGFELLFVVACCLYTTCITKGHGAAVKYVQSFNRPLLVLGGGGYTIRNVSRCWTYETSVLLGQTLSNTIPFNDSYEFWVCFLIFFAGCFLFSVFCLFLLLLLLLLFRPSFCISFV